MTKEKATVLSKVVAGVFIALGGPRPILDDETPYRRRNHSL
jgi:hypothetical protein